MSIYDKSSLVLIPSGTKTGKVYSQKPVNGDGDFTFSRSTAATRVNADGNIEKETQNLLLQSNTFDTTWTNSGTITRTSGQSGYDGSNDAWLLTKGSAGAFIRQTNSQSGVRTFSIYAKADTADWLLLDIDGSPDAFQYFDLGNGVLGATGTNVDATITSVGGSWYRCSVTGADTYTEVRIYPAEGNNNVGGTTTQLYIQDAQLEQGMVARDYIETTTAAVEGGITDNVPRLDYTDSSCPSLKLEPQRTNLVTQSEYYDTGNGYFNSFALHDIVTNTTATTSPTGDYSATKIIPDTSGSSNHNIYGSNVTSGTKYAVSIFAKAAEYDYLIIRGLGLGGSGGARFNISTGVVEGVAGYDSATIEDYGNGWYRCIAIGTATSTTGAYYHASPTAAFTSFQGNNSDGIYIYGAQIETGSYATSYIPTYGTSVTRNADSCLKTGISSLIGQTEGTLFVDMDSQTNGGNQTIARLQGGTAYVIIFTNTSGNVYALTSTGGLTLLQSGIENQRLKISISYKANDYIAYVNGVQKTIASSASTFIDLSEIYINRNNSGGEIGNENLNQLLVFKTRLTNGELAALTTI